MLNMSLADGIRNSSVTYAQCTYCTQFVFVAVVMSK